MNPINSNLMRIQLTILSNFQDMPSSNTVGVSTFDAAMHHINHSNPQPTDVIIIKILEPLA